MPETYDAVVIGAGQAGTPLAQALANAGRKTAIIERAYVGGTCINYGCTPTKTMVASARVAYLAGRSSDYGVRTGDVSVDMKAIRQRKREIVESFRSSSRESLKKTEGVDLIDGEAHFTGPKTLQVDLNDGGTRELNAEQIFINVGQRPRKPDIPGLDSVDALNNVSIMELDEVPGHLIILGGSYVGMEFGQMFRRFGSEVTVVEVAEHLVDHEDADVSAAVEEIMREDGVTLLLNAETKQVEPASGGGVRVTVETPDGPQTVEGSHLLVAVGRTPNSDTLNLEAAGVETAKHGYIKTNERLETNVEGIYALGDVKGGPAFTHISYDDFRVIRANLLEGGNRSIENRLLIYTMFIDPQLGRVGLTEAMAREQGYNIKVAKMPAAHAARAIETANTRGLMKIVVDADTDQMLGAAILALDGGEIMAIIKTAMVGNLPYTALRDGIYAHPTMAESLNNLLMTLEG